MSEANGHLREQSVLPEKPTEEKVARPTNSLVQASRVRVLDNQVRNLQNDITNYMNLMSAQDQVLEDLQVSHQKITKEMMKNLTDLHSQIRLMQEQMCEIQKENESFKALLHLQRQAADHESQSETENRVHQIELLATT